jgi:3-hydroxyisobutyrate dehydrogenase
MIGVGVMGLAMSRNLLAAGFEVHGYDPAERAMANLRESGGEPQPSPQAVAERCPIMITSLPSTAALEAAVAGANGIAAARGDGHVVLECSTLPLDAKRAAHDALARTGKTLLDCPLSGTGAQAAKKDLVVFASGDRTAFERCLRVFEGMSRRQRYLGAFGNGSVMKYVANLLVTIHNVAAGEAMVLGMKAGLDPGLIYDTIADSAGSSRIFEVRGPLMRDSDYDHPTATIRTHLKDISIINAFAAGLECPVPLFSSASQVYFAGAARGREGQDTASVCAVLEEMAGMSRASPPAQPGAGRLK